MLGFLQAFSELAQTQSVWIYLIIFFGKLIEVATSTLRIVLINRGIRLVGSLIAIFEITLWLIITGSVIANFQSDPLKMVIYALAFACGNYLGSWLDEKFAFGLSNVQIVVSDIDEATRLGGILRDHGYGMTTVNVHGINDNTRYMMFVLLRRKCLHDLLALINKHASQAVVTVTDVKVQKGGYLRNSPTRPLQTPIQQPPACEIIVDAPPAAEAVEAVEE